MLKKILPLALALSVSSFANADEADVRKGMEARLGTKVESVTKAGFLGLYEVYADGNIFYTDDKVTAIMVGAQLIDAKSMKNVIEERVRKLTAIKFNELPLDRAIKQVRGDGKRVLATFEVPNCGYCKRLALFFNEPATAGIPSRTLRDALPICPRSSVRACRRPRAPVPARCRPAWPHPANTGSARRPTWRCRVRRSTRGRHTGTAPAARPPAHSRSAADCRNRWSCPGP